MEIKLEISIPNNIKRIEDCNIGDIVRFNKDTDEHPWTYIYAGKFREEHLGICLFNGLKPVGAAASISRNDDCMVKVIGTAKLTYNP